MKKIQLNPSDYSDIKDFIKDFFAEELKERLSGRRLVCYDINPLDLIVDEYVLEDGKYVKYKGMLDLIDKTHMKAILLTIYEKLSKAPFKICQYTDSSKKQFIKNAEVCITATSLAIAIDVEYRVNAQSVSEILHIEINLEGDGCLN